MSRRLTAAGLALATALESGSAIAGEPLVLKPAEGRSAAGETVRSRWLGVTARIRSLVSYAFRRTDEPDDTLKVTAPPDTDLTLELECDTGMKLGSKPPPAPPSAAVAAPSGGRGRASIIPPPDRTPPARPGTTGTETSRVGPALPLPARGTASEELPPLSPGGLRTAVDSLVIPGLTGRSGQYGIRLRMPAEPGDFLVRLVRCETPDGSKKGAKLYVLLVPEEEGALGRDAMRRRSATRTPPAEFEAEQDADAVRDDGEEGTAATRRYPLRTYPPPVRDRRPVRREMASESDDAGSRMPPGRRPERSSAEYDRPSPAGDPPGVRWEIAGRIGAAFSPEPYVGGGASAAAILLPNTAAGQISLGINLTATKTTTEVSVPGCPDVKIQRPVGCVAGEGGWNPTIAGGPRSRMQVDLHLRTGVGVCATGGGNEIVNNTRVGVSDALGLAVQPSGGISLRWRNGFVRVMGEGVISPNGEVDNFGMVTLGGGVRLP